MSTSDIVDTSKIEDVRQPSLQAVRYSRGTDKYDNKPEQRVAENPEAFFDAILNDRGQKKGQQYICAPMVCLQHAGDPNKYPGERHYRQAVGAEASKFLVFDFDGFREGDELAPRHVLLYLGRQYQGVGYTTARHTKMAPRFRIVVIATRPMSRHERITISRVIEREIKAKFGQDVAIFDKTAYQSEQAAYLPLTGSKSVRFEGQPVDVDEVLARAKPEDVHPETNARTRRQAANENPFIAGVYDYPPSDAHKIAERCATLRHMRDIQGADQDEPLWIASLQVLVHTEQADDICHAWSSQHSGYDEGECQDKIEHARTMNPPTCDHFRAISDHCAGCEATCKSPIRLGEPEPTPESAERQARVRAGKVREQIDRLSAGMLVLPSNHLDYNASAEQVFGRLSKAHALYRQGLRLVEVVEGHLHHVDAAALISRIDAHGTTFRHKYDSHGKLVLAEARCRKEEAGVMLKSEAVRTHINNIARVSPVPVLIETGDILTEGYHDHGGGLLVHTSIDLPVVSVAESVGAICKILSDFDFVSDGDYARAIAMIITPAMAIGRMFPAPVPQDYGEANVSQSGKTYRQYLTRLIYAEDAPPITQRRGGVGSFDEDVAVGLSKGRNFLPIDNVRGHLNSPLLEAVLTWQGETIDTRIPHLGHVTVDPRSVVVQMSSNGLSSTNDLANRSCVVRIRKQPDHYQYCTYPEGSLDAHIKANQPYFLSCVYTIIGEWIRQGKPTIPCRHDRQYWAGPLNWIVQTLFGTCDLMEGHEAAKRQMGDPATSWLRQIAMRLETDGRFGEVWTAYVLAEYAIEEDIRVPGVQDWGRPETKALARRIGALMKEVFNGSGTEKLTDPADGTEDALMVIDKVCIARAMERPPRVVQSGANAGRPVKARPSPLYAFAAVTG